MKSKIKLAWLWLVRSSADPKKASLFVRASLTTVASALLFAADFLNLNISNEEINTIVNSITDLVFAGLTFFGTILVFVGFVRKVALTATGQNKVVNTFPKK